MHHFLNSLSEKCDVKAENAGEMEQCEIIRGVNAWIWIKFSKFGAWKNNSPYKIMKNYISMGVLPVMLLLMVACTKTPEQLYEEQKSGVVMVINKQ